VHPRSREAQPRDVHRDTGEVPVFERRRGPRVAARTRAGEVEIGCVEVSKRVRGDGVRWSAVSEVPNELFGVELNVGPRGSAGGDQGFEGTRKSGIWAVTLCADSENGLELRPSFLHPPPPRHSISAISGSTGAPSVRLPCSIAPPSVVAS